MFWFVASILVFIFSFLLWLVECFTLLSWPDTPAPGQTPSDFAESHRMHKGVLINSGMVAAGSAIVAVVSAVVTWGHG